MNFKLIPVLMVASGLVLVYCAITDRNPIDVVKAAVTGEEMPVAGSLSSSFALKEPDFTGDQDQLDIGGSEGTIQNVSNSGRAVNRRSSDSGNFQA